MSLSWACLGREGTRYPSFQHCVFHRGITGARGALTQLASLPRPHFPLSSPPSPLLSSSSACLSHCDSSVRSALTCSHFPRLLTITSSCVSFRLWCLFLHSLVHSICPSISHSLPLSLHEIWEQAYYLGLCICAQRKVRKINQIRTHYPYGHSVIITRHKNSILKLLLLFSFGYLKDSSVRVCRLHSCATDGGV